MRSSLVIAFAAWALCAALPATAAPRVESAPLEASAKEQAGRVKAPEAWQFDEYFELHRQSGFALYASPFDTLAKERAADACAKSQAVPVN